MADIRISQLTAKSNNLEITDEFAIAESDGSGGFVSKKINGAEIKDGVRQTTTRDITSFPNTLTISNVNKFLQISSGIANTTTIPPNSSVAFPIGTRIEITQSGSGQTQVAAGSGVTLRSAGGATKINAQYGVATLLKVGTDIWHLFGDITT
tara:strand:+ start:76 stop:531 length:456 start_codon:yes stop_codon:yes gene_type:complete